MTLIPTYGYFFGLPGSEQMLSASDAQLFFTIEDNVREALTLGGTLTRDFPALNKIRHWRWQWSWLPGKRRDTYDGGLGRNDLFTLYQNQNTASNFFSLVEPSDVGAPTTYVVTFALNSWTDEVVLRTAHGDGWRYRVAFELRQVS